MIRYSCPGCQATYTASDEKAGTKNTCPKCWEEFTIPAADTVPPPAPVTSSKATPKTVDISPCPSCGMQLSVEERDLGTDVECPGCQRTFKARIQGSAPAPRRRGDDDRPSRRRDDDDDDRPRRRRDDDDDYDDDRPRRRRGRNYVPHRGVLILVFGILAWVVCMFFGIASWIMASADLKEMDAGRMDPEGRQMTQIGKYLGMANVILSLVFVLGYCLFIALIAGAGAAK